jgi:hypothetical protein
VALPCVVHVMFLNSCMILRQHGRSRSGTNSRTRLCLQTHGDSSVTIAWLSAAWGHSQVRYAVVVSPPFSQRPFAQLFCLTRAFPGLGLRVWGLGVRT